VVGHTLALYGEQVEAVEREQGVDTAVVVTGAGVVSLQLVAKVVEVEHGVTEEEVVLLEGL